MIEEIPFPFPTIQEFIEEQEICMVQYGKEEEDIKACFDDYKYIDVDKPIVESTLGLYDVAFNTDPGLVFDFSKKANISYTLAEALLIIFFQELKNQIINGKYISIPKFGKFFTAAPGIDNKGKFRVPSVNNKAKIYPKYKLGRRIRMRMKKNGIELWT